MHLITLQYYVLLVTPTNIVYYYQTSSGRSEMYMKLLQNLPDKQLDSIDSVLLIRL